MEEYEVDLRDYIRVIWQKKWLILAVFLGAVLVAAVFSFTSPNVYETEALLQLEGPPAVKGAQIQMPSVQLATALLKSPDLISQTVKELEQAQITSGWLASNLTVSNQQGNLLQLRLRGSLGPSLLKQILDKHIALFKPRIEKELNTDIEKEQSRLERQKQAMLQQLEALKETMRAQSDKLDTVIMWFTVNSLYSKLWPIEAELADLNSLQEELNAGEGFVKVLGAPAVPEAPVSPNRRKNMLVGGVLGLFLGVLSAFFMHYMEGGKAQSTSLQINKSQVSTKKLKKEGGEEQ